MWLSQRLASIGLESWQGAKARVLRRDRRVTRPSVTLLEERTLLSQLYLTVNTLADDPNGPTSGSTTLRDAITQANASAASPVAINFASGLQGTIDLTKALPDLANDISIQGPDASNLTVQRDPSAVGFSVFAVDGGETVSLSGITISGGGVSNATNGGGIDNFGTLTVSNSVFSNNSANDGGGLCNEFGGALTVSGSTFTNNYANVGGGLINFGTGTVRNCIFSNNSAMAGGGIYNASFNQNYGTLTVNGSTFINNSAYYNGGGIYNTYDEMLTVINSTFIGNSVSFGNINDGGGGGGISNDDGTATVINCTVSGNTSQYGSGISNYGSLTLDNTIVANNTSTGTSDNDISGSVQPTSAFNVIGDGSGITNLTDLEDPILSNLIGTTADPLNPLLGPLQNNGGPTQTMALLPGSPAINAGSIVLAVDANGNPLTTDQRGAGFPRTINGTVDIGACEFTYGSQSQTISGPLANQTYGVAPITLTATATSNLPVSYMVISGPATISGSVLTITGAGLVDVEMDQAGNATYAAATPVDESFTVTPALLTVNATNEPMVYGGTVPALTYTYTGLVNSDTSVVFGGSLATTATSSSSVGGYPITVGTLVATGNYTIGTYNPSILTIAKADTIITVTPYVVTYDGNVHNATGTSLTGLVINSAHTNAGTYTDSWTYTDPNGNYNSQTGIITDTIAKANASINVTPYSVTYDGNSHTATGVITGVNGVGLSGLTVSSAHTNAGTYADSWVFSDTTGNYNNASGTITDAIAKQ
jgi:MBG domain (YGX type)